MNFTVTKVAESNIFRIPEWDVTFELLPIKDYADDEAKAMIWKHVQERSQLMYVNSIRHSKKPVAIPP